MNKSNRSLSLSLCMIVKNEAGCLARCLDSVTGLVDEIIIVDTGSTDKTVEVAAAYQAVIIHHPWQGDFAQARNIGLDHAQGDWILMLDADEALDQTARSQIKAMIATTSAAGLRLLVRSWLPAGELQQYTDIFITRLFRNRPEFRYEQTIHEQIRPSIERHGGNVLDTHWIIWHYGYAQTTAQGDTSRAVRNLEILEKALAATPHDAYLCYQLGATYKALNRPELAETFLRRVLDLDDQTLDKAILDNVYMKLAQLALAGDDYTLAGQYAQQSLTCNPNNLTSMYVLALAYMFQGQIEQACPFFQQIRHSSNANPLHHTDLDQVLAYCRSVLN